MVHYLKLMRWPNLALIIATQLVVIYGMLETLDIPLALKNWQVILLIVATTLVAAGGNVINDIYDQDIDAINKPHIRIVGVHLTENNAFNLYIALTITAVISGFIVANSVQKPMLAVVYILVAFGLYSYANGLKKMLLIGNILISLLVALVFLITGLFELFPIVTPATSAAHRQIMGFLLDYSIIAFFINLAREWVKDCQDMNGDYAGNCITLPIAIGRTRASKLTALLLVGCTITIGWYVIQNLTNNTVASYYIILGIIGPLLYTILKLWNATTTSHFKHLSLILKIIMALGIASMIVIRTKF